MNLRWIWWPTLAVSSCLWSSVRADDWPQWLGPKRDSVWRESGIVEIFPELNQARQIYTDGRKHPPLGVSFMGHAIGKWDKDTLVVETVGLRGGNLTWLDLFGTPHTDDLRVMERIKRPTYDTLEIDFRFEDPGAFTKPWEGKKRYYLMSADWEQAEYVLCDPPKALGGTDEFSF